MTSTRAWVVNPQTSPRFWGILRESLRPTPAQLAAQESRALRRQLGELRRAHLATQARLRAFRAASVEKSANLQLTGRSRSVAALTSG